MPVEPLRGRDAHPARDSVTEETDRCRSFTSQPAPTQWVAVGVTALVQADGTSDHCLLVGTGRTEADAERALRDRCRQIQAAAPVNLVDRDRIAGASA